MFLCVENSKQKSLSVKAQLPTFKRSGEGVPVEQV